MFKKKIKHCCEKLLIIEKSEEIDHTISFSKRKALVVTTLKMISRNSLFFFNCFRCVNEQGIEPNYREEARQKSGISASKLAISNHSSLKNVH